MPTPSREQMLAKLRDAYTVYFDEADVPEGAPHLASHYVFYCTNECYMLSKKVTLWSAETNEYVYVFSLPELTASAYAACRDKALALGMPEIRPHFDHRSSFITAVFVCDHVTDDAAREVAGTRIHKDFMLSLKGWMDFRAAAVDLSNGAVSVNRAARELKGFLRGNLEKCYSIEEESH